LQREKAKSCLKENDKEKAKFCLNKSKMYKAQSESSSGQLMMVEEQLNMIETTKNQNQIFKVLEQGNTVLKQLQEEVNVEKWEAINEDMAMNREKHNEMNDFFKNHGIDMVENDEDLDKELEKLEKTEAKKIENQFPDLKNKNKEVVKEDKNKENEITSDKNKKVLIAS
jgi:charged multivesicular body protein 6